MAGERAHQRAVRPSGRRFGVDRPDRALGGRAPSTRASARRRAWSPSRAPPSRRRRRAGSATKTHVDVADVVQLAAAALAHRDDRQPAPARRRRAARPGRPRAPPRGSRRPGRRARRRRRSTDDRAGQVAGRERRAAGGGRPPAARPARRGRPAPATGRRRRASTCSAAALAAGARSPAVARPRLAPVLGVAGQVVAEGDAGAEHRDQPVAQSRPWRPERRRAASGRSAGAQRLDQPDQRRPAARSGSAAAPTRRRAGRRPAASGAGQQLEPGCAARDVGEARAGPAGRPRSSSARPYQRARRQPRTCAILRDRSGHAVRTPVRSRSRERLRGRRGSGPARTA